MKKEKLYKKCPRCGEKTYANAKVCDNCKLVFSRLEFASNKEAKKAIKAGAREQVILSKDIPRDLNKWKLFFLCLFGGALGIHNIYIGRYVKGFFSFFFTVLTAVLVVAVNGDVFANLYSSIFLVPGALVFIWWFYDLFMIGIGRYKVPIALDMPKVGGEYGK